MASLESSLKAAVEEVYREPVDLTPSVVRNVVAHFGGGSGKKEIAAGNKALAEQLGVSVRTVQRWQKEPGTGEARSVARSTQAPHVQQVAAQQRMRDQGIDVEPCQVYVHMYNDRRSRPRYLRDTEHQNGPLHISGETMGRVVDALNAGEDTRAAAEFAIPWLEAYRIPQAEAADAEITDVVGQLSLSL